MTVYILYFTQISVWSHTWFYHLTTHIIQLQLLYQKKKVWVERTPLPLRETQLIVALWFSLFRFPRCSLGNEHWEHSSTQVLQEARIQADLFLWRCSTFQECDSVGTPSVTRRSLEAQSNGHVSIIIPSVIFIILYTGHVLGNLLYQVFQLLFLLSFYGLLF